MKKDLISVIIPVWRPNNNHLKYCINSVINQTYSNLEIILIYKSDPEFDNNFRGLMKEYSDKRIKIIESSQKGVAFQRNLGIKNSTGEFLANIDSDDYCIENRFERQIKVIKSKKCNVLGSWAFIISNAGKKIGTLKYPITHSEIRKKIILHDFIINSSVLMERKMLDDIGLFDPSLAGAEDYELWLRAMSRGFKFANIPEYLVYIRENPHSLTRGTDWRRHRRNGMEVRKKAVMNYGFSKPLDIFYYFISPLRYLISPRLVLRFKKLAGWYKTNDFFGANTSKKS